MSIYKKIHLAIKKEDEFDNNMRKQYLHCLLVLFTIFFIVFIFSPVSVLANVERSLDSVVLLITISLCIIISLMLSAVVVLLRKKYKYFEIIIMSILFLCFTNAVVFPFRAQILDGSELARISDDIMPLIRNVALFLLFVIIGFFARRYTRYTFLALLASCIVFTGYSHVSIINSTPHLQSRADQEEIIQSAAEFSSYQNVVVIVMDMLQGTAAEQALLENPEYLDIFGGFTVFTRGFTSFPFTNFSMQAIKSGNEYSSEEEGISAHRIAANDDSFMMDYKNTGGRVEVLGIPIGAIPSVGIPSVGSLNYEDHPWETYITALRAAIARITGYWPSGFMVSGAEKEIVQDESISYLMGRFGEPLITYQLNSLDLHRRFIEQFAVGDDEPKLLFIWNATLHAPIIFHRDGEFNLYAYDDQDFSQWSFIEETLFGFAQLQELFELMKINNVYDNSLIIVTSDHGHHTGEYYHIVNFEDFVDGHKHNGNVRPASFYNIPLFIKPPYAQGEAVISHNDVWNGDVRSIIRHYMENFENDSPIDAISYIRSQKPYVSVMFVPLSKSENMADVGDSTVLHQQVLVSSLFELPAAFAEISGIVDE